MGFEDRFEQLTPRQEDVEDQYSDEKAIKNALESGKLGYDEISVMAIGKLFLQAPKGRKFQVPSDILKFMYENDAKAVKRKDLKFEVSK